MPSYTADEVGSIWLARRDNPDLRLAGLRRVPTHDFCNYYELVGYHNSTTGSLIFRGNPEHHPDIKRYFKAAEKADYGPWLANSDSEYLPIAPTDLIASVCSGVNIYWHSEIVGRVDVSRYPQKCPIMTCRAPAYIGVVPTAIDCSSPNCRYHQH